MSGQPHRGHLAVLAGWPAKVPILKEVTSEKSKSVELNTFATYLSSLSGVIAEYNSNYAQKWEQMCWKSVQLDRFAFSRSYFFKNWYSLFLPFHTVFKSQMLPKSTKKYQSLLISVSQRAWFLMSYIISEIYSLQGTSNNFEMLMLSESWSGKIQSILIWFISIHLKSSLLNRANRTNSNRGTIMNRNPLFQRLANWAIISIALLPVTNYLPWWRTMIYWTWTSRLAWYHMNEYILYRTAM